MAAGSSVSWLSPTHRLVSAVRLPMAAGSSVSWLSPTHSLVSAVRLPMEAGPWTLLTMLRFTAQA